MTDAVGGTEDPAELVAGVVAAFTTTLRRTVLPDDNFFALGGRSIQAAKLVAQLRSRGLRITLRQFFAMPTPRAVVAQHLTLPQPSTQGAPGVPQT
jgi:aryl carrier-like protein